MMDFSAYIQSEWSWVVMAVMLWSQWRGKENMLIDTWWYSPLFGLLGGFTTMIGNAAA